MNELKQYLNEIIERNSLKNAVLLEEEHIVILNNLEIFDCKVEDIEHELEEEYKVAATIKVKSPATNNIIIMKIVETQQFTQYLGDYDYAYKRGESMWEITLITTKLFPYYVFDISQIEAIADIFKKLLNRIIDEQFEVVYLD